MPQPKDMSVHALADFFRIAADALSRAPWQESFRDPDGLSLLLEAVTILVPEEDQPLYKMHLKDFLEALDAPRYS